MTDHQMDGETHNNMIYRGFQSTPTQNQLVLMSCHTQGCNPNPAVWDDMGTRWQGTSWHRYDL